MTDRDIASAQLIVQEREKREVAEAKHERVQVVCGELAEAALEAVGAFTEFEAAGGRDHLYVPRVVRALSKLRRRMAALERTLPRG